ncbi:MAG TPA: hypothetical protein ENI54_05085, partial [bacterium]|nr:hypothetical protein [bacterium]
AVISTINNLGGPGKIKQDTICDIAASVREAVAKVLYKKIADTCDMYEIDNVIVSGGVSANSRIRTIFAEYERKKGVKVLFPSISLSADNAAMIGYAGFFKQAIDPVKNKEEFLNINADSSWEL